MMCERTGCMVERPHLHATFSTKCTNECPKGFHVHWQASMPHFVEQRAVATDTTEAAWIDDEGRACECPDCSNEYPVPEKREKDIVEATIAERGTVYGDPEGSHANIGLAWTALLQQHYGTLLDHPLPSWLVALMLASMKLQRSTLTYKEDNFIDLKAYGKFAEEFQKSEYESNQDVKY